MPDDENNKGLQTGQSAASMLTQPTSQPTATTPPTTATPKHDIGMSELRRNFILKNPNSASPVERQNALGGAAADTPLQAQLKSAIGTARSTIAGLRRGIERKDFSAAADAFNQRRANFIAKNPNAVSPQERAQYAGAETQTPKVIGQQPTTAKVPADDTTPIGGAAAQGAGVKMRKSGGRDVALYEYGGMQVDLPSGIDLNDDAAVGNAIAENNTIIDFMNGGSEEEEVW